MPSVQGLIDLRRCAGFAQISVQSLDNPEPRLWSGAYRRGVPRNQGKLDGVLSAEEQAAIRHEADEALRADESCAVRFLFRKPV